MHFYTKKLAYLSIWKVPNYHELIYLFPGEPAGVKEGLALSADWDGPDESDVRV